jgi:hypothetical protein
MTDVRDQVAVRLAAEARARTVEDAARWTVCGAIGGVVLAVIASSAGGGGAARAIVVALSVATAAGVGLIRARRRWTPAAVAEALERRQSADNLVVTAEALSRVPTHSWQPAVASAAWSRLEGLAPPSHRGTWLRLGVAAMVAIVAAVVPWPVPAFEAVKSPASARPAAGAPSDHPITALSARVVPPAYLGGVPYDTAEATTLEIVGGSQVTLLAHTNDATVRISRDGTETTDVATAGGVASIELPSPAGGTWLIAPGSADDARGGRLLVIRVVDDAPPVVRVVTPGRDRRLARPLADLRVTIDARDDHALTDVRLRLTTVSGSGENLTFADREVRARIDRTAAGVWTAEAVLPLATLGLDDGDLVVYRGVAADARPGAPAVESDAFLVEVGPLRAASDAGGGGEDVDPEQRQAISQQMVIVKTERLHARTDLTPDARLAEAQGLAVEQRMVRAEFVFLMGGEVEDEEEEAAQAHDLVEGRLANQGQAALLGATRAMSRAEARLVAGDTVTALVAEREALRLLQQAFDRRRFLLRPVAERARIDPARRLEGTTPPGPSRPLPVTTAEREAGWDAVERAALALARAGGDSGLDLVAPAARVAVLESGDGRATAAAAALVRADNVAARAAALIEAQRVVHAAAARRLAVPMNGADDRPLSGAVADAVRRRRP